MKGLSSNHDFLNHAIFNHFKALCWMIHPQRLLQAVLLDMASQLPLAQLRYLDSTGGGVKGEMAGGRDPTQMLVRIGFWGIGCGAGILCDNPCLFDFSICLFNFKDFLRIFL